MAVHKLVVAENSAKAVDILADQEVLVERLAVPAADTPCMVAAALFVSERSWQDCHCQRLQAFHSWDRNSREQGRVCGSVRRPE
ncbi:MAG: hypothetical protein E6I93_00775 [Chloroflexi bacterium]|nr:MAG: hypothetical protein E6I93_00775 [Chloroflexota bacterium]